ncbi:MAG: UDP-N-acetylmuramate dehydrogenase [Desulfobacterales bacterium]
MDDLHKNWLGEHFGRRVRFEEPMARHTWFKVGGPAEALVTPADTNALARLLTWCRDSRIPWLILGSGSNLLVRDGGIAGVVISLSRCLKEIELAESGSGIHVTAQAGVKLPVLCRYCIAHGFSGLNFALGIPATVGGAIVMNAGTARGSMADVLESLGCLHPDGRRVRFARRDLAFSYRRLALKPGGAGCGQDPVIVEGTFALQPADRKMLADEAARILKERAARQPIDQPSAGCFFKNPPAGRSAGELIDKAGLKGRQIGGARVSEKHANFIVNAGGATAGDILDLMELVQGRVSAEFGIDLVPEVKIVGH